MIFNWVNLVMLSYISCSLMVIHCHWKSNKNNIRSKWFSHGFWYLKYTLQLIFCVGYVLFLVKGGSYRLGVVLRWLIWCYLRCQRIGCRCLNCLRELLKKSIGSEEIFCGRVRTLSNHLVGLCVGKTSAGLVRRVGGGFWTWMFSTKRCLGSGGGSS